MDTHHDHYRVTKTNNNNEFIVTVNPEPPFKVKEQATFGLKVIDKKTKETVPLQIVHEKKMHLIFVSHDFRTFIHKHPVQNETGYRASLEFDRENQYTLFADYTPEQQGQKIGRFDFQVGRENKIVDSDLSERLKWEKRGYSVKLNLPKNIRANQPTLLSVDLSYIGKEISDLQLYLGSLAHIVIISDDVKDFLHVHPMKTKTMGPKIEFHTNFPKTGNYHLFVEFKHQYVINVAHFVGHV